MSVEMTGGCQCRRIRYRAEMEGFEAYLCHCRMCQRATGGVSAALCGLRKDQRHWEREPDWFASSPIARRPFCARCGTPLGFEYLDSDMCDLTVGSFDDPSRFRPVSQFGIESRHMAWRDTADLPGTSCADYAPLVERWKQSGKEMPQ